jgi:hypothetical protein
MAKFEYSDYVDPATGAFKYKEYVKTTGKLSFGAFVILAIIMLVFLINAYGNLADIFTSLQSFFSQYSKPITGFFGLLQNYSAQITEILLVATIVAYIASMIALTLLKIIGVVFIWILTIVVSLLSIFLLYEIRNYPDYYALFILLAAIPPVILAFFWKRLKIASKLVNLTADLLMRDKRIFWNGVMYGILNLFLTIGIFSIYINMFIKLAHSSLTDIYLQWQSTNMAQNWYIVIMTFLYFFLVQVSYNYYYGATIHMAHAFYRDCSAGNLDGFRVMTHRLRPLMAYAVFSSILFTIQWVLKQFAKRSKDAENLGKLSKLGIHVVLKQKLKLGVVNKKSISQRVANWAIKMLGKLWLLLNFFTLPALIIQCKSAPGAIAQSAEYVGRNAVDVFINKTAVRSMFKFTVAMFIIIAAAGGAVVGLMIMDPFSLAPTTAIIGFGVLFGVFAGIPGWIMSKNLDIVYVTFLYLYIMDEDLAKAGVHPVSKFVWSRKIIDDKYTNISNRQLSLAIIGFVAGIVALILAAYGIYVMLSKDFPTISAMSVPDFHVDYLQVISYATGYALVPLGFSALLFGWAKRKYMTIALLIGMAFGFLTLYFINIYIQPLYGAIQADIFIQHSFKIVMSILETATFAPLFFGTFIEIYVLTQDLNIKVNDIVSTNVDATATPVETTPPEAPDSGSP